jgi:hypothetical protein
VSITQRQKIERGLEPPKSMNIDDTMATLTRIRGAIDKRIPRTITRPDGLTAALNELYVQSVENRDFDELFEYSDVGSPSITLAIRIDADSDLKKVVKHLQTRLHATQPGRTDEIGSAGIVWSSGRYDFVFDEDAGLLRVSHKYSHQQVDTKSVLSIVKRMIDYALDYLEEIKTSAKGGAGGPHAEGQPL